MAIAEQLRLALSQPYLLNGLQFYCSTSIGVTLWGGEEQDAQTLLSQADLALYRAKAAGRDRLACATPAEISRLPIADDAVPV